MRGLKQFNRFDFEAFSNGKVYSVTNVSELVDFETKNHLGTRVECAIAVDKTPYEYTDGKVFTNKYEKIVFKVLRDVDVPLDAHVMPKNVTASIYGDFKNQLSVYCEDLAVATPVSKKQEA